jgi:hypothetical protein
MASDGKPGRPSEPPVPRGLGPGFASWRSGKWVPVGSGASLPLDAACDQFRLELRGNLVAKNTLEHYDYLAGPLFGWLGLARPEVRSFETLRVEIVRAYRAALTERHRLDGRPLQPRTLLDSHKALLTFFRWARAEGYAVDPRLLELKRPKVPRKSRPSIRWSSSGRSWSLATLLWSVGFLPPLPLMWGAVNSLRWPAGRGLPGGSPAPPDCWIRCADRSTA